MYNVPSVLYVPNWYLSVSNQLNMGISLQSKGDTMECLGPLEMEQFDALQLTDGGCYIAGFEALQLDS